ncbi:hypothetical protein RHMOL_Rhmol04G0271100 [Rhododendron molle]|uniref:Uncharacterized protein n=1 Tax=Rhododendron molle TaxID=49168 RepID=A0ACC0P7B4_RHOML|nr:hypothetical protein RHMOL_Rhmol04G0271100 [Rhododendron molle]
MAKFDFRLFVLLLTVPAVVLMVVDQAEAKPGVCQDTLDSKACDAPLCRKLCGYIHRGNGHCVESENPGGGFSKKCVCYYDYECHHE